MRRERKSVGGYLLGCWAAAEATKAAKARGAVVDGSRLVEDTRRPGRHGSNG